MEELVVAERRGARVRAAERVDQPARRVEHAAGEDEDEAGRLELQQLSDRGDADPAQAEGDRGREPLRRLQPEELQEDGEDRAGPDDREHPDRPLVREDEEPERGVRACDQQVDASVVEAGEPPADTGPPRRTVIERARAEAAGDADREDERCDPRLAGVSREHERNSERDRDEETDLMEHASQPWFHPWARRNHCPKCTRATLGSVATRHKQLNIGRLGEIAQVAVRHGFGYAIDGRRSGPPDETTPTARGRHLREMFDELGPTFVKFGQLLSTRPDVVPPDIIAELRRLQDDVSPFPFADVERVIREDLGQPIERLFLEFDEQPLAAASIGQVHRAVLPNGREVVVKVQRPNAPRQIEADLALMYQAARLVKERVRLLDFIDTSEIVDEFARSIRQELDYRLEGRNAEGFHRDFAGHPHVVVPRTYWSYTRTRVLTLEYLDGVQLGDLDVGAWSLEQRRELAYLIAETWMTMIFRNGFFHGDPHPANILVLAPDRIGLVDFGIAGKLTDQDMTKLTRLFIDAANENIEVLPRRLADLGVRYPKDREAQLIAQLHEIYGRYYGARLQEIDPLQIVREGFSLIYSNGLRLPTRFVLLDKALATVGSVGIELYEDFNVFEVAKPYARSLMLERFTAKRVLGRIRRDGWQLAQMATELPYQVNDTLEQVRRGQIEIGFVHKGLDELLHKLDAIVNRLVIALVVTGGLIGSSLIGIFAKTGPHVLGVNVISVLGFVFSGVLGVWLLWGVIRSGRL